MPDYSLWLLKKAAAKAIGCSTKTVEDLAIRYQKIETATIKGKRNANVRVYHPGDVDKIAKLGPPFIRPEYRENEASKEIAPRPANSQAFALQRFDQIYTQLLERIANPPAAATLPPSELRHKRFLTEAEAIAFTGLSRKELRATGARQLRGPHQAGIYRRTALEAL